jgi:hypothetical protein
MPVYQILLEVIIFAIGAKIQIVTMSMKNTRIKVLFYRTLKFVLFIYTYGLLLILWQLPIWMSTVVAIAHHVYFSLLTFLLSFKLKLKAKYFG